MRDQKIDSTSDFTSRGLGELKAWMEPWWQQRGRGGGTIEWEDVGLDCSGGGGFADGVILLGATSSLLGYWRLGDAASPFLDSNSYLSHSDELINVTGAALTPQVSGCLSTAQDDGAVNFNGDGTNAGDYLKTTVNGSRFDFTTQDFSTTFFMKPLDSGSPWQGGVVGTTNGGTISNAGWGVFVLMVLPGTHTVFFRRAQDGGTLVDVTATITPAVCSFVAATYSSTNGARLYINGALVASDATVFNATATGLDLFIGKLGTGNISLQNYFFGSIDEVAVWGSELTATDIANLYSPALMATFTTIKFGDYLNVTDEGSGVIRVDGCPPGGGGGTDALAVHYDTAATQGAGHYLYSTTDAAGPNGYGIRLIDAGTYGTLIETTGAGNLIVECDQGDLSVYADVGDLNLGSGGLIAITNDTGGTGIIIDNNSGGNTIITADGTSAAVEIRSDTHISLLVKQGGVIGNLTLYNLPTSAPTGASHVWNNGGVLNIT